MPGKLFMKNESRGLIVILKNIPGYPARLKMISMIISTAHLEGKQLMRYMCLQEGYESLNNVRI